MKVLITGGAGYIGSTVASACIDAGITPVLLDDLRTGREAYAAGRAFYEGDVADGALIDRIVDEHPGIFAVVHCAARTVVSESVEDPLGYYDVNVGRGIQLLQHLARHDIRRVVFSSSASVYAADGGGGLDERASLAPASPYARSKAQFEKILADAAGAGLVRALCLRYFNPIGVDPALRTGTTARQPTHALGVLLRAWRSGAPFTVTGTDWPTRDGSGLRDFIHVWDLAQAHVRAVERFDDVLTGEAPFAILNVGTGEGTTVRELVASFRVAVGEDIEVTEGPRRPGDVAGGFAIAERANELLDWRAEASVEQAIRDAVAWERRAGI